MTCWHCGGAAAATGVAAGTGIRGGATAAARAVTAVRAIRAERTAALERGRAVKESARAEDLLTFMLGDLYRQLERAGRLDVLEAVFDKETAYFFLLRDR